MIRQLPEKTSFDKSAFRGLNATTLPMPNTLGHIGIQTLATRSVYRQAPFHWIALGCIIPDLPWISQRMTAALVPGTDLLRLRIYTMIQASLLFSLILAAGFCLLSSRPLRVWLLLAGNCFCHLILDGLQEKWANGVHLLAPFSWRLSGWHLFWPEQWPSHLLTMLGGIVLVRELMRPIKRTVISLPTPRKIFMAAIPLLFYLVAPFFFFQGPMRANNHYVATLMDRQQRPGQFIAIDRCRYEPEIPAVRLFTGESLLMRPPGLPLSDAATISVHGTFLDTDTIQILEYHVHGRLRDIFSLVGLTGIAFYWLRAVRKTRLLAPSRRFSDLIRTKP